MTGEGYPAGGKRFRMIPKGYLEARLDPSGSLIVGVAFRYPECFESQRFEDQLGAVV